MLRPIVVAVSMLCLAAPARAQTFKRLEISGAYAFLNDSQSETEFRAGWMVGTAVTLTDWLSAVGEAGGNYATIEGFASDTRLSVHAVMAGARAFAKIGRLTEFLQVVAGTTRASGSRFGVTETHWAFAVQPGVGLDLPLRRQLSARAQIDARYIRSRPDGNDAGHQIRFVAAIVYHRQH